MLKSYDQRCCACGHVDEVFTHVVNELRPCTECGGEAERVWLRINVIGDEYPGGRVFENLGHTPVRVDSKSEYKRELEKRGLENRVKHVGMPGSDKSPNTVRWV